MKTKLFTLVLTCLLYVNMFASSVWSGGSDVFTHGSGTQASPYLVESADQLAFIAEMVNAGVTDYSGNYFKQTTDFDLNNIEWTPIGEDRHPFGGNYDGNHHSISGLVVSLQNIYSGLFGYVQNGTFCNINLQGTFALDSIVGGIIGYGKDISISNCTVNVQISGGGTSYQLTCLGGVIGEGLRVNVFDCTSHGLVTANTTYTSNCVAQRTQYSKTIEIEYRVGGIAGDLTGSRIVRCMNDANIMIESTSIVRQSYAYSMERYPGIDIDNQSILNIGGIVGYHQLARGASYLINKGNISGIAHSSFTHLEDYLRQFGIQRWNWQNTPQAIVGGIAGNMFFLPGSIYRDADTTWISLENEGNVSANGTSYFVPGRKYDELLEQNEVHTNNKDLACGISSGGGPSGGVIGCFNNGNITSDNISAGIGELESTSYCYNSGYINGKEVYGICCCNWGIANNCYNVGTLVGTTIYGVGRSYINSYYLSTCGASGGGVPKTDVQMKSVSFPIMLNADSTVFYRDTKRINNGYPIFVRQIVDTISFDAESGICEIEKKVVHFKTPYGELPTASREGYSFEGWFTEDGTLVTETTIVNDVADHTLHAHWNALQYTISGIAEHGHIDGGGIYGYNSTITLTAVADDHYHFVRWADGATTATRDVKVTKDTTFTALFDIDRYIISFVNDNRDVLQTSEFEYGQMPTYNGTTPIKPANAQYTYTFTGWDKEISAVADNETYTAVFSCIVNKYTITFVDENGTTLQTSEVEYGQVPAYNGATPTKPAIGQYTYTFAGWSPSVAAVTGNAIYTATYSSTTNGYLISFVNYDGTFLQSGMVNYGVTPAYTGTTPAKPSTAQYSYTFKGWDKTIAMVTGAETYTALFDSVVNKYTITFADEDGTTLQTSEVEYGQIPAYNGITPSKAATAQYTYTFIGWTSEVAAVSGTTTYIATYSCTVNKYTITFVDENGYVLQTSEVEYGQIPAYNGATPFKPSTSQCTYTFAGWTPEVVAVTGNASYTAIYSSTVNKYTITFVNSDGSILQTREMEYGLMPTYSGATPTKSATPQYTYSFIGWTPEIVSVTENATYTATYSRTINQYTISFVDEDGTILQTSKLQYGQTPAYTGAIPTKFATAQYTYTFSGWTPNIMMVAGNATYTAMYSTITNKYTITFLDEDGTLLQTGEVEYGQIPAYNGIIPTKSANAQYTYSFAGWSPVVAAVSGMATYIATYRSTINSYPITFVNYDGATLQSGEVNYGVTPAYSGATPVKPSTAQYTYTFKGWDKEIVSVVGVETYTAQYDSIVNKYTITFVDEDGTVLQASEVEYGQVPAYNGATPFKPATAQYTYSFAGWTSEVVAVTTATTYTATYSSTINSYPITFVNYDGSTLQSGEVNYGLTPTYAGTTPTKPATAQYTYTFVGWDKEIVSVVGVETYTAQFDSVINKYTIIFLDEDGTTLQTSEVEYGQVPAYNGTMPFKPATAQYSYTFASWSPEVVAVTAAATYTATYSSIVNQYTITVVAQNGVVTGAGTYDYGTSVEISVVADNGYQFVQWSDGVTDNPRLVIVSQDATYEAVLEVLSGLHNISGEPIIVYVSDQRILHVLTAQTDYCVYSANGQLVYEGCDTEVLLPQAGSYVIRLGRSSAKVVTK